MQKTGISSQSVLPTFGGYTKNAFIAKNQHDFLDDFWYNAPYLKGKEVVTFSVQDRSDDLSPYNNVLGEFGFMNFVLVQGEVMHKSRV